MTDADRIEDHLLIDGTLPHPIFEHRGSREVHRSMYAGADNINMTDIVFGTRYVPVLPLPVFVTMARLGVASSSSVGSVPVGLPSENLLEGVEGLFFPSPGRDDDIVVEDLESDGETTPTEFVSSANPPRGRISLEENPTLTSSFFESASPPFTVISYSRPFFSAKRFSTMHCSGESFGTSGVESSGSEDSKKKKREILSRTSGFRGMCVGRVKSVVRDRKSHGLAVEALVELLWIVTWKAAGGKTSACTSSGSGSGSGSVESEEGKRKKKKRLVDSDSAYSALKRVATEDEMDAAIDPAIRLAAPHFPVPHSFLASGLLHGPGTVDECLRLGEEIYCALLQQKFQVFTRTSRDVLNDVLRALHDAMAEDATLSRLILSGVMSVETLINMPPECLRISQRPIREEKLQQQQQQQLQEEAAPLSESWWEENVAFFISRTVKSVPIVDPGQSLVWLPVDHPGSLTEWYPQNGLCALSDDTAVVYPVDLSRIRYVFRRGEIVYDDCLDAVASRPRIPITGTMFIWHDYVIETPSSPPAHFLVNLPYETILSKYRRARRKLLVDQIFHLPSGRRLDRILKSFKGEIAGEEGTALIQVFPDGFAELSKSIPDAPTVLLFQGSEVQGGGEDLGISACWDHFEKISPRKAQKLDPLLDRDRPSGKVLDRERKRLRSGFATMTKNRVAGRGWHPSVHLAFSEIYQSFVIHLLLCHVHTPTDFSILPREIVLYEILPFCDGLDVWLGFSDELRAAAVVESIGHIDLSPADPSRLLPSQSEEFRSWLSGWLRDFVEKPRDASMSVSRLLQEESLLLSGVRFLSTGLLFHGIVAFHFRADEGVNVLRSLLRCLRVGKKGSRLYVYILRQYVKLALGKLINSVFDPTPDFGRRFGQLWVALGPIQPEVESMVLKILGRLLDSPSKNEIRCSPDVFSQLLKVVRDRFAGKIDETMQIPVSYVIDAWKNAWSEDLQKLAALILMSAFVDHGLSGFIRETDSDFGFYVELELLTIGRIEGSPDLWRTVVLGLSRDDSCALLLTSKNWKGLWKLLLENCMSVTVGDDAGKIASFVLRSVYRIASNEEALLVWGGYQSAIETLLERLVWISRLEALYDQALSFRFLLEHLGRLYRHSRLLQLSIAVLSCQLARKEVDTTSMHPWAASHTNSVLRELILELIVLYARPECGVVAGGILPVLNLYVERTRRRNLADDMDVVRYLKETDLLNGSVPHQLPPMLIVGVETHARLQSLCGLRIEIENGVRTPSLAEFTSLFEDWSRSPDGCLTGVSRAFICQVEAELCKAALWGMKHLDGGAEALSRPERLRILQRSLFFLPESSPSDSVFLAASHELLSRPDCIQSEIAQILDSDLVFEGRLSVTLSRVFRLISALVRTDAVPNWERILSIVIRGFRSNGTHERNEIRQLLTTLMVSELGVRRLLEHPVATAISQGFVIHHLENPFLWLLQGGLSFASEPVLQLLLAPDSLFIKALEFRTKNLSKRRSWSKVDSYRLEVLLEIVILLVKLRKGPPDAANIATSLFASLNTEGVFLMAARSSRRIPDDEQWLRLAQRFVSLLPLEQLLNIAPLTAALVSKSVSDLSLSSNHSVISLAEAVLERFGAFGELGEKATSTHAGLESSVKLSTFKGFDIMSGVVVAGEGRGGGAGGGDAETEAMSMRFPTRRRRRKKRENVSSSWSSPDAFSPSDVAQSSEEGEGSISFDEVTVPAFFDFGASASASLTPSQPQEEEGFPSSCPEFAFEDQQDATSTSAVVSSLTPPLDEELPSQEGWGFTLASPPQQEEFPPQVDPVEEMEEPENGMASAPAFTFDYDAFFGVDTEGKDPALTGHW